MSSNKQLFGLLNFNKPAGWTSRKAVDYVKRLVRPAKIGHAGTLDPLATGVLILCVGPATRLVPYLHGLRKTYRATFEFGCRSATDDTEGEVEPIDQPPVLTRSQIELALPSFLGEIEQVPPQFSAVKIRGRRAYDLARRGRTPEIKPRTVSVESIRLDLWEPPQLQLEITCGTGTYIRSIGRDLAESLGSAAVMSGLTRTSIGPFTLDDALEPAEITPGTIPHSLQPAQDALVDLPVVTADDSMLELLRRGRPAKVPDALDLVDAQETALIDRSGQLMLIAVATDAGQQLQPRHVLFPLAGRM